MAILNKHKTIQSSLMDYDYYASTGKFNEDQLEEIQEGFSYRFTMEQIAVYAKPEFDSLQMQEIFYGIYDKLYNNKNITMEQIQFYADPKFDCLHMGIIRDGFEEGLTMEQVKTFADPNLYWCVMNNMKDKLLGK